MTSDKDYKKLLKHKYFEQDFYDITDSNFNSNGNASDPNKYIHFLGYIYDEGEPGWNSDLETDDDNLTSRHVEYSGFIIPLSEFLSPDFEYDHLAAESKQYIDDISPIEAYDYLEKTTCKELSLNKITMNTPCGSYVNI